MGLLRGGEGVVEAAEAEMNFGEGVPGLERVRRGGGGAAELGEGGLIVAHRVVEGGVLDQVLDFVVGHGGTVAQAAGKKKGRRCRRPAKGEGKSITWRPELRRPGRRACGRPRWR